MLKDQKSCSLGRNVQEKARRKRRNRRRKKSLSNTKGAADVESEDAEENKMEAVETSSIQTQTRVPVETQQQEEEDNLQTVEKSREQRHKDAKMANAQTQTRKPKGEHKFSQTPVVFLCSQETQTDVHVAEQDDASEGKTEDGEKNALTEDKQRADNSAQTQVTQNEDNSGAQKKEDPPAGRSGDPTDSQSEKGAKPSYAKVVSGGGAGEKQSKMDASEAADKTTKPPRNLS